MLGKDLGEVAFGNLRHEFVDDATEHTAPAHAPAQGESSQDSGVESAQPEHDDRLRSGRYDDLEEILACRVDPEDGQADVPESSRSFMAELAERLRGPCGNEGLHGVTEAVVPQTVLENLRPQLRHRKLSSSAALFWRPWTSRGSSATSMSQDLQNEHRTAPSLVNPCSTRFM